MPQEKEAPKLCRDCKWIELWPHNPENFNNAVCSNPKAPHSLVTGTPTSECWEARKPETTICTSEMTCGPEGKWWEAKEVGTKVRPKITLGLTAGERADFIDVLDKMRQFFQ